MKKISLNLEIYPYSTRSKAEDIKPTCKLYPTSFFLLPSALSIAAFCYIRSILSVTSIIPFTFNMKLWLSELRAASAMIEFHFYNGDNTLVAEAQQKGLFIDTETKRPRRLQSDERELFSPYVLSAVSQLPVTDEVIYNLQY